MNVEFEISVLRTRDLRTSALSARIIAAATVFTGTPVPSS